MRLSRLISIFSIMFLASCSGSHLTEGGDRISPEFAPSAPLDQNSDLDAGAKEMPFGQVPLPPAEPAPVDPDKSGEKPLLPSGTSFRDDLTLSKIPQIESIQKKACQNKRDQCMAAAAGSDYSIEKQRACETSYNGCLSEETPEQKCEGGYQSCMATLPGSSYAIETQRACVQSRDNCLATKVYPACCENAHASCLASIPAGAYRIEQERSCEKGREHCLTRFYCE